MLKKLWMLLVLTITLMGTAHASTGGHLHHRVSHVIHNTDVRPSAWCGWQMRQWHPQRTNINLNLAKNWAYVGTATIPRVGAIIVWRHHVGEITGYDAHKHQWVVKSGNDSHRVRERPRSIAGAIAFRSI